MSSTRRHDFPNLLTTSIAIALAAALLLVLALGATQADAAAKKLPKVTKVTPKTNVFVGKKLTLTGKNFVKGKKKLVVIFKRDGSKRRFTAQGTATSSTRATVVVPDVSGDLLRATATTGVGKLDNLFRLRAVTKYGAAKEWTGTSISPTIGEKSDSTKSVNPVVILPPPPPPDCDADGTPDSLDADDDNDLLIDTIELAIGTNVCAKDTDGDIATDYYEYTIAYAINGGPVLPYPKLMPYPNPIVGDDGDYDNDKLTTVEEFKAWQYSGYTEFYSDADADSDNDGIFDWAEDVDSDLLPNFVEANKMPDLYWLKTDTDGDGLCDGLDDQDHDGPPTPLAEADCSTPVPNNGPDPAFPPTDPSNTVPGGDPDLDMIDGDDNEYSNFYEWYNEGALADASDDMYDVCTPSIYPVSPYCDDGQTWNPFPIP